MTVARENLNVTSNDFQDSKLRTADIASARENPKRKISSKSKPCPSERSRRSHRSSAVN